MEINTIDETENTLKDQTNLLDTVFGGVEDLLCNVQDVFDGILKLSKIKTEEEIQLLQEYEECERYFNEYVEHLQNEIPTLENGKYDLQKINIKLKKFSHFFQS